MYKEREERDQRKNDVTRMSLFASGHVHNVKMDYFTIKQKASSISSFFHFSSLSFCFLSYISF